MRNRPSVLRQRSRASGRDYVGGVQNGHAYGRFNPGHDAAAHARVRASEEVSVKWVIDKKSDLSRSE